MTQNLIHIIVPIYNAVLTLGNAIDSVLNQNYQHWQLLLIDDGSTDNSLEVCKYYASYDNRIRYIHQENQGVSSARNLGLSQINSAGYILFLDSDDEIAPDALLKLNRMASLHPADIILGEMVVVNSVSGIELHKSWELKEPIILQKDCIKLHLLEGFFLPKYRIYHKDLCWNLQSCLFKASLIRNNAISFDIEITVGEDCLFVLEALSYASMIILFPTIIHRYSVNEMLSKYALKAGTSSLPLHRNCFSLIKRCNLSKLCKASTIGMTFMRNNLYIHALMNRNRIRQIRPFINSQEIKVSLLNIILMNREEMEVAQISNRQKIAAIFYLIGCWKMAL